MFQVQENGEPCDYRHFDVHSSWKDSTFNTFDEAEDYALKWLYPYAPQKGHLKLDEDYDYTGYGDIIKIVQLE